MILGLQQFKRKFKATTKELFLLAAHRKIKFLEVHLSGIHIEFKTFSVVNFLNKNRFYIYRLKYIDGKVVTLSNEEINEWKEKQRAKL